MSSVAVFVDAGYLFAQGSTALTGSKQPRSLLKLNETAAVAELVAVAHAKSGSGRLLRVYWYDGGLGSGQLTLEHAALAHTDYIKLRRGFMNRQGQQKGVDSLIVTDLIELARNQAISDAVLLSGDEDVRIGITPARGSQSLQLLQEADTTTEWDSSTVGKFLSQKPAVALTTVPRSPLKTKSPTSPTPPPEPAVATALEAIAAALLGTLDSGELSSLNAFWANQSGVPREIDGKLLAQGRAAIGRDLTAGEKRYLRQYFSPLVPKGGP